MTRYCIWCAALTLLALASFAEDQQGAAPRRISYNYQRTYTVEIPVSDGGTIHIDKGIEWRGIKVYVGSENYDLVGVDEKTGKALWNVAIKPYWKILSIKEVELPPGNKIWAAELRVLEKEDRGQNLFECYELKTGAKLDIPGSHPAGKLLARARRWGGDSACAQPFIALVSTPENYVKVNARLHGTPDLQIGFHEVVGPPQPGSGYAAPSIQPPPVDFSKEVVLVYCDGDTTNCSGTFEVDSYEDDRRILLRTETSYFQTMNDGVRSRTYAMFALPRRTDKAYALEYSLAGYINGPPNWNECFRLDKLSDPGQELAAMPLLRQTPSAGIQGEVKREIKKFKTQPRKKDPNDKFGDFPFSMNREYDYYLDTAGKEVFHGFFRAYEGEDENEIRKYEGPYVDGVRHGEWRFWSDPNGREIPDRARNTKTPAYTLTFDHGVLHGPCSVLDKNGSPAQSGQFEHGKAHGTWVWMHTNGKKSLEASYDHGLLHGRHAKYAESGAKLEEIDFVNGQARGIYSRWYDNGQLALQGDCTAGATPPPPNDGAFGSSDFRFETHDLPCYRNGIWTRYARDGNELWRGSFDHGTGTVIEFRDDGSKFYEAQIVNGARLGEYKEWNPAGWLEKQELRRDDGSMIMTTFYKNGQKRSHAVWRDRQENGLKRWWSNLGELDAECEFIDGHPWSGDYLEDSNGTIWRYANGKPARKPVRYTTEAQQKFDAQKRVKAEREKRGIEPRYSDAKVNTMGDAENTADKLVAASIGQLGSPDKALRSKAESHLAKLGPAAVPMLAQLAQHRDLEIARRAVAQLSGAIGAPGKPNNGVTLSATLAGPRPQPGEAVPLLVTLTNTTQDDLYILQHWWSLYARRQHTMQGRAMIGGGSNDVDWSPRDYLKLAPGASHSLLMDAEPYSDSGTVNQLEAVLQLTTNENARKQAPGKFYNPDDKLVSAFFEVSYRTESAVPEWMDAVNSLTYKTDDYATKKLTEAGSRALEALRLGLRNGDPRRRWNTLVFVCNHPLAELEDDIVACWGRWGNGWVHNDPDVLLNNFSLGIPKERRLPFLLRIAEAKPQDHRNLEGLAELLSPKLPDEKPVRETLLLKAGVARPEKSTDDF